MTLQEFVLAVGLLASTAASAAEPSSAAPNHDAAIAAASAESGHAEGRGMLMRPFRRPGWSGDRAIQRGSWVPLIAPSQPLDPVGSMISLFAEPPRPVMCFDRKAPPSEADQRAINTIVSPPMQMRYNIVEGWSTRSLSWSFVPDGLSIPDSGDGDAGTGPSVLYGLLDGQFGSRAVWEQIFQDCFDRWSEVSDLSFTRVRDGTNSWDSGGSFSNSQASATTGVIRISARNIDGPGGILAYAYYPSTSALGGNMVIDSSEDWSDAATDHRAFRNTLMHELGHALGLAHVCPAVNTKLMEPFLNTAFLGPQHDDVRGIQTVYDDPYGPIASPASAYHLGTMVPGQEFRLGEFLGVTAVPSSSLLSIKSISIGDYFAIDLAAAGPINVDSRPEGTVYDNSTQNANGTCNSGNIVDSRARGILRVSVLDSAGTILSTASAPSAGGIAALNGVNVPAGRFYVRADAIGPLPGTQNYRLRITAGTPPPPPNDNCAQATLIGVGTVSDDNGGASTQFGVCSPSTGDMWYRFVPTCTGVLTVNTCGSLLDTVLSVHNSCTATSLACNDNAPVGSACGGTASSVSVNVAAGTSYYIRVASRTGAPAQFTLNVLPVVPANDTCANATTLAMGVTSGSTCGASIDGVSQCDSIGPGPDVWYRYTAPCNQTLFVSTCNTAFDTVLSAYQGSCGSLLNVACNDDDNSCGGTGRQSTLTLSLTTGVTYFFRVSGFAGASGPFTLNAITSQPYDTCATARAIGPGSYSGAICGANRDWAGFCTTSNSPDAFFTIVAPASTTLFLDTCGSDFATTLEVYSGSCSAPAGITCSSTAANATCPSSIGRSRIDLAVQGGVQYIIRLSGQSGQAGNYVLNAAFGPLNDRCEFVTDVVNNSSTAFSSINAGGEGATSAGCGNNGTPDIWFRHFSPCPTTIWYSICNANFDTQITLYTGGCGFLTEAGCNNNSSLCPVGSPTTGSFVARRGTPSQSVYIRVSGAVLGGQGTGTLRVICCRADFNASGSVTVQDIFDFLAAYFASNPLADINLSGSITVQDIFDFLASYFNGCS